MGGSGIGYPIEDVEIEYGIVEKLDDFHFKFTPVETVAGRTYLYPDKAIIYTKEEVLSALDSAELAFEAWKSTNAEQLLNRYKNASIETINKLKFIRDRINSL